MSRNARIVEKQTKLSVCLTTLSLKLSHLYCQRKKVIKLVVLGSNKPDIGAYKQRTEKFRQNLEIKKKKTASASPVLAITYPKIQKNQTGHAETIMESEVHVREERVSDEMHTRLNTKARSSPRSHLLKETVNVSKPAGRFDLFKDIWTSISSDPIVLTTWINNRVSRIPFRQLPRQNTTPTESKWSFKELKEIPGL
ncbi:hypothetical protein KQX54_000205 [Cotesia glomerata]|uniref:Uncharacterized protein n=1 Tax=Cotesia glomerata TaxID=32391 RepID=A0AAV7J3D4_COTGL|nr:hypothetical protein KQX54_000205 [Cotesia glomerata]